MTGYGSTDGGTTWMSWDASTNTSVSSSSYTVTNTGTAWTGGSGVYNQYVYAQPTKVTYRSVPSIVRVPILRDLDWNQQTGENTVPTSRVEYEELTWEEYVNRRRETEPNYNNSVWYITGTDVTRINDESTEEQRALAAKQRAERERQQQAQWEEAERQRQAVLATKKAASERARELLLGHLDQNERKEFLEHSSVTVKVGTVKYRVRLGRAGNIDKLKGDGSVDHRLCVHVQEQVPDEDNVLAQVLLLKTDPKALLSKANVLHW